MSEGQSWRWFIDGNNVMGSRPDGWWNDRPDATRRLAQRVAEWCRTHDDVVTLVFDGPVDGATLDLAGGNLAIEEAPRRGRNAADDYIVEVTGREAATALLRVVTSDRGLMGRLDPSVEVVGAGEFRARIDP